MDEKHNTLLESVAEVDILADAKQWLAEVGSGQRLQTHSATCHRWHSICLIGKLTRELEGVQWRIKIRENIIGRLVAANERLRNVAVTSCETVACDEMSPTEDTDRRSITSYEESDEKRVNTNTNREATPAVGSVQDGCTLTDEEREAIEIAAAELDDEYYGTNCKKELAAADTLRKLLERLR
jgi:hypothetical protein